MDKKGDRWLQSAIEFSSGSTNGTSDITWSHNTLSICWRERVSLFCGERELIIFILHPGRRVSSALTLVLTHTLQMISDMDFYSLYIKVHHEDGVQCEGRSIADTFTETAFSMHTERREIAVQLKLKQYLIPTWLCVKKCINAVGQWIQEDMKPCELDATKSGSCKYL